jgi:hypothetical protein
MFPQIRLGSCGVADHKSTVFTVSVLITNCIKPNYRYSRSLSGDYPSLNWLFIVSHCDSRHNNLALVGQQAVIPWFAEHCGLSQASARQHKAAWSCHTLDTCQNLKDWGIRLRIQSVDLVPFVGDFQVVSCHDSLHVAYTCTVWTLFLAEL